MWRFGSRISFSGSDPDANAGLSRAESNAYTHRESQPDAYSHTDPDASGSEPVCLCRH